MDLRGRQGRRRATLRDPWRLPVRAAGAEARENARLIADCATGPAHAERRPLVHRLPGHVAETCGWWCRAATHLDQVDALKGAACTGRAPWVGLVRDAGAARW